MGLAFFFLPFLVWFVNGEAFALNVFTSAHRSFPSSICVLGCTALTRVREQQFSGKDGFLTMVFFFYSRLCYSLVVSSFPCFGPFLIFLTASLIWFACVCLRWWLLFPMNSVFWYRNLDGAMGSPVSTCCWWNSLWMNLEFRVWRIQGQVNYRCLVTLDCYLFVELCLLLILLFPSSSFSGRGSIHWYLDFGNTLRLLQWDSVFLQWDKVTLKFFWVLHILCLFWKFFALGALLQFSPVIGWLWGK